MAHRPADPDLVPDGAAKQFSRSVRELRGLFSDLGVWPFRGLRSVVLVITTDCNLRCEYCYADRKTRRTMDWRDVCAALDVLDRARHQSPRIVFYGGEPLLEMGLIRRVVSYAKSHWTSEFQPAFELVSNGTLIDEDVAGFLDDNRFSLDLSFDGVEEGQKDRGSGTFDKLDRLLKFLKDDHSRFFEERLEVKLTLTGSNLPFLSQSIRYFLINGVRNISVVPLATHDPGWNEHSLDMLDDQLTLVGRLTLERWKETGDIPVKMFRDIGSENTESGSSEVMCGVGSGSDMVIDVDGQVFPCRAMVGSFQSVRNALHGDLIDAARIGKLTDPDLFQRLGECGAKLRAHPVVAVNRNKGSSYGRCCDCRFRESCAVCPASITHRPGLLDPNRIPDNQCGFNLLFGRHREVFERETRGGSGAERCHSPSHPSG